MEVGRRPIDAVLVIPAQPGPAVQEIVRQARDSRMIRSSAWASPRRVTNRCLPMR